jgi:hypothetical protein
MISGALPEPGNVLYRMNLVWFGKFAEEIAGESLATRGRTTVARAPRVL